MLPLSKVDTLSQTPLTGADFDAFIDNHFIHMFDVFVEGVFYLSHKGDVFFYNPSFYAQFGITSGHIHFDDWLELVHPLDKAIFQQKVDDHMQTDECKVTTQYRVRMLNGQYLWIEGSSITKVKDGKTFMIGCHRDVSDQKLMESYIQQAAFRDSASGLSNRSKLLIDIEEIVHTNDSEYSLVYIQVDDIKSYINQYGPEILKELLDHLIAALQDLPDDFADYYRIRSDDFAVLVKGHYEGDELRHLGERIMEQYHNSLSDNEHLYGKDISLGIYPNIDKNLPAEEIVKIACRTCQFTGSTNGPRLAIYSGDTQRKVERHFFIEQSLKKAIKNDIISVKFQPIICAQTDRIASFEALVRWRSKEFGEIYPDEFIPVAEKKRLIVDLGYLVFEKACQFIHQYHQKHSRDVRVNVNVSVLQLLNSHFPERVKTIAELAHVPAKNVVLELTETFILDGNKHALEQLNKLSGYGFKLSLDDFGAGYSSLNSFFDLPLDQIKIDKSMAWRSLDNVASREYLRFVTQLCRSNNVDIVVEGIENAEMQRSFIEMGVSYLQGYWLSKPLSLASASRYTLNQYK
ncbi:EAL domain-containing protein [Vibrio paucivorans]|uniref:EAL domain-containing protein n=1 Tax=Vibrio paucivorans TaxID=2829489 RepID=A0A9X3HSX5_9VIBR|nr:EAL domain-containing protein [Vibrio paucivorans]MCW8335365.1 EAL domain-containing protein [Vibrio paucivorans]